MLQNLSAQVVSLRQNQHDQVLIVAPESAWSGAHHPSESARPGAHYASESARPEWSLGVRYWKDQVLITRQSWATLCFRIGKIKVLTCVLENWQDQVLIIYQNLQDHVLVMCQNGWDPKAICVRICKVRCSYCFRICKISRSARLDAHYASECVRWIAHYALESGWPNQECASLGELLSFRSLFLSLFLVSVWRIRAFWIALWSMISPISLCTQHRSWM
jgi:hypothetical protein